MNTFFSKLFASKKLFYGLVALICAVLLVCLGILTDYIIDSVKQYRLHKELTGMLSEPSENYSAVTHPETGEKMYILSEYVSLFEQNPDLVGWIKIGNTRIDYPVMQTPDRPNYYLQRDFNETYSKHGTVYVKETADVKAPSDNMTLFGHRMNDGTMFSDLLKYQDEDFFLANPTITFDTIYAHGNYQILAAFPISTVDGSYFPYYAFIGGNAQQFADYVEKCKELSLYDTGVDAVKGDRLITLSTCGDAIDKNKRFVVVAKKIQQS